jgi:hypothetical protein
MVAHQVSSDSVTTALLNEPRGRSKYGGFDSNFEVAPAAAKSATAFYTSIES